MISAIFNYITLSAVALIAANIAEQRRLARDTAAISGIQHDIQETIREYRPVMGRKAHSRENVR